MITDEVGHSGPATLSPPPPRTSPHSSPLIPSNPHSTLTFHASQPWSFRRSVVLVATHRRQQGSRLVPVPVTRELVTRGFCWLPRCPQYSRLSAPGPVLLWHPPPRCRERKFAPFVRLEVDCEMPEGVLLKPTSELGLHKPRTTSTAYADPWPWRSGARTWTPPPLHRLLPSFVLLGSRVRGLLARVAQTSAFRVPRCYQDILHLCCLLNVLTVRFFFLVPWLPTSLVGLTSTCVLSAPCCPSLWCARDGTPSL